MKKNILILLFVSFSLTGLLCQQVDSDVVDRFQTDDSLRTRTELKIELSNAVDYYYELIKFYISEAEYDLALSYLDSISSNMTDSLYFFTGLSYQGKSNWEQAADNFGECIINHRKEELLDAATLELKNTLQNLSPMIAIERISNFINELEDGVLLAHFLFIMAWVYEENQLFDEANDVYRTIIRETDYEDKINTKLKIATNLIFLKEFAKAKTVLIPIIALNDSTYNQNALFFSYIANHSLNDFPAARNDLLRLYQEYPVHTNKIEILQGLAEIFEKEQQYLISWYMLQELEKIISEVQKIVIQREIERIKGLIGTENISTDQFEYLKPAFDKIESKE